MSFKIEFEKLRNNIKNSINNLTQDDYKEQVQGYKHEVSKRKKDNAVAMSILEDLENENRQPTKDELNSLLKYTGTGALGIGSKDEYYTPEYLAKSTWDLMGDLSDGDNVLDPSAGVGIFGRNAPNNINIKNIEYNGTSAKISNFTSDGVTVHSSFEKESYNMQDNSLDGVITNVPFGNRDRLLDTNKRFDKVTKHEHYFIMRSLELLKAGKRAVFIVPSSFISNTNQKEAKQKILEVGSFVGAIKLPNKVFSHSGANVCTDIVVFEKHPLNVVRNLQDRRYSPKSINNVIYEDENNKGFLYGKYFEKNKKNVLGKFIKSKKFQETKMFDGNSRGDQCITTDDMETIKEKIAKITKHKFNNTLLYDNLVALDGSVIIDTVTMEKLEKDLKDFREYYYTMRDKGYLTIKQLEKYIKIFSNIVNNKNSNLLKTIKDYDYIAISLYYNLSKKGYAKKEIVQFIKIGILLRDLDGKKITNNKIIKTLKENISQVKYISDKSNIKYLKFTKDKFNYELHNANISAIFTRISNGVSTNWDTEKNEPLNNSIEEIKTFASIIADKNINYDDIPLSEDGYVMFDNTENKIFTANEILENKEIFIKDGKIIAKGDILYNGANISDLKNYLENVKFEDSLGLTQEQFNEKLASIKASIEPHFEAINASTLKLNQYNVTEFLPETAYPRIKVIKRQAIKNRNFLFINSGANIKIDDAYDIVKTSFGIGQFFKNNNNDVSYMFDLYGDEIKKLTGALDKDNFLETVRLISEKDADVKRDFLNKIVHIIHKHNAREIARYNIAIDENVKNDKLLIGLLKENINKNNRVSLDQNEVSGRLNQMNEYVNTNILDTNHDYQNTDISNFSDSMSGIIAQDTGLGKGHHADTDIITSRGMVKFGTLKVGDYVIGSDGHPTRIKGVYPRGKLKTYRVDFIDGSSVVCDEEHIWNVRDCMSGVKNRKKFKNIELKDMLKKSLTQSSFDKRYGTTQTRYRYGIPFTPECYFDNGKELEINPYVLGFLLGNGSLKSTIGVVFKNREICNKFNSLLNDDISFKESKQKSNCIEGHISKSKEKSNKPNSLSKSLKKLNLLNTSAYDKFIPTDYLYSSLDNRKALFQGLIDSDGHILKTDNIEYETSSKRLIEDYRILAYSLGIKLGITSVKENPSYVSNGEKLFSKHPAYTITQRTDRSEVKAITNITQIEDKEIICISVEAEDSLYVVGKGFNLTHNTRTIFLTALNVVLKKKAKRSLIVVPTAIIDKWELSVTKGEKAEDGSWKEEPILRDNQKELVAYVSNNDKSSWNKLKTNKKAKIVIMTSDSFKTLTFRDETLNYLRGDTQKEQEAKGGKNIVFPKIPEFSEIDWKKAYESKNSIGYFEEADIGFMIVDEAQDGKNSLTGGKSFKFGSSLKGSYYGNRLSLVSALLRDKNDGTKGTVFATATPFTSSPYEIYTMLKNSGGLKNCRDLDSFQNMFFITNERMINSTIRDNVKIKVKVFEGLTNLNYLKQIGLNGVEYRSVDTECKRNSKLRSIKPEYETLEKPSEKTEEIIKTKNDLVKKYDLAKEIIEDNKSGSISISKVEEMKSKFGLDFNNSIDELKISSISSSFGVIDKLSKLSISKDFANDKMVFNLKDIDEENKSKFLFKLLKKKIKIKEKKLEKDKSDGSFIEVIKEVDYRLEDINKKEQLLVDDILTIPVLDSDIADFIIRETKNNNGLLNIKDYPKYELLIENIRDVLFENSNAKQLVFSLNLTGAKIIEYFVKNLYKDLKIEAKLMSSLNIKSKKTEDDELGEKAKFQQEYNSEKGATVLIFTKAYSKGIDLNIMTTAIHLVDIPYSPDVWHQAMGRGVRQGNKTERVKVFTYSQDGTIDTFKLKVLTEKSNWQDEIIKSEKNTISTISVNTEEVISEAIKEFGGNATDEQMQVIYDRKIDEIKVIREEEEEDRNNVIYQEVFRKIKLSTYEKIDRIRYIENIYDEAPETSAQLKQLDKNFKPKMILSNIKNKGKIKNRIWKDLSKIFASSNTLEECMDKIKDYNVLLKESTYFYLGILANYIRDNQDTEAIETYVKNVEQEAKDEMIDELSKLYNIEELKKNAIEDAINTLTNKTQVETLKDIKSGSKIFLNGNIYNIDEVAKFYMIGNITTFEFNGMLFSKEKTMPHKIKSNDIKSDGYLSKKHYTYRKAIDNYNKYTAKIVRLKEENKEMINMYFDGKEPVRENYNHSITSLSKLSEISKIIEDDDLLFDNILEVEDFHIISSASGRHHMKRDNILYSETLYYEIREGFEFVNAEEEIKNSIDFRYTEGRESKKEIIKISENSDFSLFDKLKIYSRLQNAIKDGFTLDVFKYAHNKKSLYLPIYELIDFEEKNKKALELEDLANSDDKFNMSKDDLKIIFNKGDYEVKRFIIEDILDGKYTQLRDFKKVKDRIDDEDYFFSRSNDKGILIDEDLNLLIYGTMPSRNIKKKKENIGISYSRYPRKGYDKYGKIQTQEHTWKTDINSEFLGRL